MTNLVALAKQAGGIVDFEDTTFVDFSIPALQAFAELIRQDEREACAVLCEKQDAHATIWDCAAAIRARTTT